MSSRFGDMVTTARESIGLTRQGLCLRMADAGCAVTDAAIDHWESGRRAPRPEAFRALCAVFAWDEGTRRQAMEALMGFPGEGHHDGEAA